MLRNTGRCSTVLIYRAIPSSRRLTGPKSILQPDNDPKHTANVMKNNAEKDKKSWQWWFVHQSVPIIESVWDCMKRRMELGQFTSTKDLCFVLQGFWHNLPARILQNLCAECTYKYWWLFWFCREKGWYNKYWFYKKIISTVNVFAPSFYIAQR